MFNAPTVFTNIPDISAIYSMNDRQGDELDAAVEEMDSNIFLDTMSEEMIARWEAMLELTPLDDDSVEDRRFRVKAKVMEKLPYSYRVIVKRLDTLCPDGYLLEISEDRTAINVKLALKSRKTISDVEELLEKIIPLNMICAATIIYNQYQTFTSWTHGEMSRMTHGELREYIQE